MKIWLAVTATWEPKLRTAATSTAAGTGAACGCPFSCLIRVASRSGRRRRRSSLLGQSNRRAEESRVQLLFDVGTAAVVAYYIDVIIAWG